MRRWPRYTRTSCAQFGLVSKEGKSCLHSSGLLHALSSLLCFVSIALVLSIVDMPALLAEVIRAWEAATAAEAARITAMLPIETSSKEASVARDNATLHVKDVKDQATLVEREALERMPRVEVENVVMLASARGMLKASSGRSFSLLVSLRWSARPSSCLRWSIENNSGSSPFYRPEASSCVMPSLVPCG
jgi:hypothetical protein